MSGMALSEAAQAEVKRLGGARGASEVTQRPRRHESVK